MSFHTSVFILDLQSEVILGRRKSVTESKGGIMKKGMVPLIKNGKFFVIVSLIFLLSISFIPVLKVNAQTEPEINHEIVCDQEYYSVVRNVFRKAESSILMIQFEMAIGSTVSSLIDELSDAKDRGVDIWIIMDEEPDQNEYALEYLSGKGFNVKLDDAGKTLHGKMIIIDNTTVIIGSTNWSDNSIDNNNEANVRIDDPRVASYYETFFWKVWANSTYDMDLGYENHDGVVPLVDRDYLPTVLDTLENAENRIYLLFYAFKVTDYDDSPQTLIFNAIVNASKRGVDVKVTLEKSDWEEYLNEMNQYTINKFKSHGIDAFFESPNRITHTKLCVVDETIILGSTNWAYSGLKLYHSLNIKITNPALTNEIINWYSDEWKIDSAQTPDYMEIFSTFSKNKGMSGESISVTGYVTQNGVKTTSFNISFWLENSMGQSISDKTYPSVDDNGNFRFLITLPDKGGEYKVRMESTKGESGSMKIEEIEVRGTASSEKDKGNTRIFLIIGISALFAFLLFLKALFKKEEF